MKLAARMTKDIFKISGARRVLNGVSLGVLTSIAFSGAASAQVDEIVVTAQKRAQNVQEIGVSVNAFSEDDARIFANDIGALAGQAPGVESYANGTFIQSFFIRGIGLNEFAGNFNAPVAIHNDEVYVSKNWQAARPNFDIGRVEIVKGPQGTLFGRNTTGGSVNFFTKEPTQEFEAYVRGEADLHERYNIQGAVSGPLSDELSGRFSFYSGFGDGGPQFNIFDGEEHGAPDVHQFRGQLKWEHDATTIRVLAYGGVDNSEVPAYKGPGIFSATAPGFCPEAVAGQVSFAPDTCTKFNGIAALNGLPALETEPADVFTINQNHPGRKNDSFYGGYLRIEHDLGGVELTSISSYDKYNRDQREDSDGTPVASADVDWFNEIDEFTQELRLTGEALEGKSNFILGGFFEYDDLRQVDSAEFSQNPFNLPPVNAGLPPRLLGIFDQEVKSFAAFFNNEYALTDQLALVMGVRYTRETTTIDATTNVGLNDVSGKEDLPATLLVPGGIDNLNANTSAANPSNDGITSNRHVDSNVSWKGGLNYKATDDVLVYAVAQSGFRTGGFSVPFGGSIVEFEREKVLAVEAGVKSRFAGDKAQLNIAGFRTRTKDAQVNVDDPLSPLVPITRNIPEIVTWGGEAELQIAPNDYLNANIGVSYLDSEITDSGGATIATIALPPSTPIQGNTPVNTPDWQISGRLNYLRPLPGVAENVALLASVDFRWVDERFLEITNQPADRAPAYTVVNARIGLAAVDERWDIALFARNLFNEEYLTYVNNLPGPGFKLDIFGERRTIGLSFGLYY